MMFNWQDLAESNNNSTDRNYTATRTQKHEDLSENSPLFPLPIVFNNSSLLLQEIESKRSPLIQECIRWMRHMSSFVADIIEELQREHLITPVVTQKKDYQRKINHVFERTNRLIQLQHELLSILGSFLQSLPQSHGQWHCKNESAEDLALVEGDLHVESIQSPVAAKIKGKEEEEEKIGGNSFAGIISLLLSEFEQKRLVGSADFCAVVGAMPVAFDVPVSRTADTVAAFCSLRSRLQHINISVESLRLNPIVTSSYGDALTRIDKGILDLTERISESIHHFHEISTTDNVLRQDWAATSSYMRDKKVTPGVIAMASSIRKVAHAFVSQQPVMLVFRYDRRLKVLKNLTNITVSCGQKAGDEGPGSSFALLTVNVALTCLLRGCLSITRLYQALNPSRVRLLQWRRDLTYWILSSKELLLWMVPFSPIINRKEDNAIGNDYLKDFFNETNETLLSELAAILKYLVAVLFLVTDSSESLLIVLQRIVSPARNTISETLTLKNEEKGGNNLPAWESLIDTLNAFASDSEQSNPPFTESQALAPIGIPVFDRMTDILFGLGLTTEPDAPAVATAWQKVITAKVVDPHSWLSSFILSQDCLVVFSLLADLGEDDIADITARNRVLLRRFLSACLYARAECTSCSYPPLSAEQIARKESLEHLMKGLQS